MLGSDHQYFEDGKRHVIVVLSDEKISSKTLKVMNVFVEYPDHEINVLFTFKIIEFSVLQKVVHKVV